MRRSARNSCCACARAASSDLSLLRALERAPRSLFMPQRYQDIAARDIALPIGCGQTAPPPSVVAAMIEALDVEPRPQCFRNRRGNRLRDGAAVATCRPGPLRRTLPDAGARGLGAAQRLRRGQCAGRLGGRAFAERRSVGRFDRIIVHGLIDGAAGRSRRASERRGRARRRRGRRSGRRAAHRPPVARRRGRIRRRRLRPGALLQRGWRAGLTRGL